MSYCRHCGTEINDDTRFCPNCGQSQQAFSPVPRQPRANGGNRLHCPNCRSHTISPVVETEVTSGMSMNHSFSRKNSVSAISMNNTHRNYWMCSDCGHKFRNLQNLEEELNKNKKNVKSAIVGIILVVFIMIASLATNGLSFLHIIMIPALLIIVAAIGITKNKIAELEKERIYLKRNCFG